MDNITFVNSTLKVIAKEDIDIKELASADSDKTIDELLQQQNDQKKEQ